MEEIFLISDERKKELDIILEKEISDLKNNIISKEEFISYIRNKKLSICDLIYLVDTYIGSIKIIDKNTELLNGLKLINEQIYITNECDINYNISQKNIIPKIKDFKRIRKYENMAIKGKKIKKRKK